MISTLHYYNSYKHLLDKQDRDNNSSSYKIINNIKKYKNTDFSYFLNKSLNDNVKAYMFELSFNFNGLKNIANNIYEKMYYNLPTDTFEQNIDSFTSIYNRFIGFLQENIANNNYFKGILENTLNFTNNNKDVLEALGINISNSGFLDKIENIKIDEKNVDEEKTKIFYSKLYDNICNFMKEPMSSYMDFRDFSYYFNYSGDYDKSKSFKIIEQGLLVDISL